MGEINARSEKGTLNFDNGFATVKGTANLGFVGRNVSFTATKVSDTPKSSTSSWNDYSDRAYMEACDNRWR
jgi:hypothetical protein